MKKILLISLLAFLANRSNAQLFGKETQENANAKLAYVWGYIRSDSLTYKSLMLRDTTQTVVMLSDIYGNPLYTIVGRDLVDSINAQVGRMAREFTGQIYGLEFTLTYLKDFSYQKKRKIKRIQDVHEKNITLVFNPKVKYILMNQNPRPILGERVVDPTAANYGKIIPNFGQGQMSNEAILPKKPSSNVQWIQPEPKTEKPIDWGDH